MIRASSLAQASWATTILARWFHRLVRVFVEQPVADAEITVLLVGVAVHAPEAVLLLPPQSPLGGVETGVGEGGSIDRVRTLPRRGRNPRT